MIYGLFRSDALEKAGIMRWQLLPDRLLLCELALYGGMVDAKEHLWFRRYRGIASIERQRAASLFDEVPRYVRWPWWIAHGVTLWREYGGGRVADSPLTRAQGRRLAVRYVWMGAGLVMSRWWMRRERRLIRPVRKRIRDVMRRFFAMIASLPGRPHRLLRPIYGRFGPRHLRD
jgi:hypothetical protein